MKYREFLILRGCGVASLTIKDFFNEIYLYLYTHTIHTIWIFHVHNEMIPRVHNYIIQQKTGGEVKVINEKHQMDKLRVSSISEKIEITSFPELTSCKNFQTKFQIILSTLSLPLSY